MLHAATQAVADTMLAEITVNNARGFAIGIGTLALLNAGLAQSKNRSGLIWFLLSLVLGPIATFALVAFCDRLPGPGGGR